MCKTECEANFRRIAICISEMCLCELKTLNDFKNMQDEKEKNYKATTAIKFGKNVEVKTHNVFSLNT